MKKRILIAGIIGLSMLNSCGSDSQSSTSNNEKQEESIKGAIEESPKELYDAYVSGYSMKDGGNPDYDKKSVAIKGIFEKRSFSTTSEGESFFVFKFIKVEGGTEYFPNYGLQAYFPEDSKDADLLDVWDGEISFTGTVGSYDSFDKILKIENCVLN